MEKNKRQIAEKLNIDFNEASELFSVETLNTMEMDELKGGNISPLGVYIPYCKDKDGNYFGVCVTDGSKCVTVPPTDGPTDSPALYSPNCNPV